MQWIGLIAGISWYSSIEYYRIINDTVRSKLGDLHSAKIVMYSFDFAELKSLQDSGHWNTIADLLVQGATYLQDCGAALLLICSNTMHIVADDVQKRVRIPILHIADVTANAIKDNGLNRVALLGTTPTMEESFYKTKLVDEHGLSIITPHYSERALISHIIYDELCMGKVIPSSKETYFAIMNNLIKRGAEGIILGCTEITLLIKQSEFSAPLFDTTILHAAAAVDFALGNK